MQMKVAPIEVRVGFGIFVLGLQKQNSGALQSGKHNGAIFLSDRKRARPAVFDNKGGYVANYRGFRAGKIRHAGCEMVK